MNINNTPSSQNFTALYIRGQGGLKTLADVDVISLPKFRNKMERLQYFDLEVTEEGAFIVSKGESGAKFGPKFTLTENLLPCGYDFNVTTNMRVGDNEPGPVELYLRYRNRQDAREAYSNLRDKSDFWRAVNLVRKLDRDAPKIQKYLQQM